MKKLFLTFLLFLFSTSLCIETKAAKPSTYQWEIQSEKSTASFLATGKPSAIKIRGEKAKPSGKIVFVDNNASGSVQLNLDDFTTGIETRDKHMKEKYLETQKPENRLAILEFTKINLPAGFLTSSNLTGAFPFEGQLTLHGQKKAIAGMINIDSRTSDSLAGKASFLLHLPDYGVEIPKFAGITVAENVEIEASFFAKSSTSP